MEIATNNPIVLVRETDGERYLPIWIGPNEATAIAFAQQGLVPQRPLTHDLMRDMLGVLDVRLAAAHIRGLRGGIFYSYLVFADGREVTARPSDSVALALRTGASIFVREEILNEAGVVIPEEEAGVVIPEEEAGVVIPPGFSTRVDNSPSGSGSGLSEPEDPQAEVELTRQLTDMVAELMRELDETRADNVRLRHQIETHRCGVYTGAREIDHAEVALTRT